MTNPLPDCGPTRDRSADAGLAVVERLGLGPRGAGACRRVGARVASMLTTAGLMRSATSAKFTSGPAPRRGGAGRAPIGVAHRAARLRRLARRGAASACSDPADDEARPEGHQRPSAPSVTKAKRARRALDSIISRRSRRNAASSRIGTPSASALASLLPGSAPATTIGRLLADRAGHLAAEADGSVASSRDIDAQRARQDERLAAQRPGASRRRSGASILRPAARARAMSRRFRGSSK